MTIVVDASVAVKFTVEEEGTAAAVALLAAEPDIVAPDLVLTEAANAYWAMVRRSRLLEIHAEDNLQRLPDFFTRLYPSSDLLETALQLSFRLRHPIYDCVYLALSQRMGVRLITADRRFAAKVAESKIVSDIGVLGELA